jgi:hypothetical protein
LETCYLGDDGGVRWDQPVLLLYGGGCGVVGGVAKCTLRDGAGVSATLRGGRVVVGGICVVGASD